MSTHCQAKAWAMAFAFVLTSTASGWLRAEPAPSTLSSPASTPASTQQSVVADPSNPAASVPTMHYRSPLAAVRKLNTTEVGDWRNANDLVLGRGGWRTYAREAQAPAEPSQAGKNAP